MISNNGPTVTYEIVYRFFPRKIMKLGKDGFFHGDGKRRGVLIKSSGVGHCWYHHPEEYLQWRHET